MKKIILTLLMTLFALKAVAFEPPNLPADIAMQRLKDGNYRFSSLKMKHPHTDKKRLEKLIYGQHPFAVVVACSDSRVPPELIFDQGFGDLFVIRNAGNVIDEDVMGSIEYAVFHLGVNLVVVMGHESCGVIGAAMKGEKDRPDIENIEHLIRPAIQKCQEDKCYTYENVIKTHAKLSVDEIMQNKDLYNYYMKHDLKVVPAYYSISTGTVEFLKQSE